jgi:DNA-binding CsgD family transcriptional regulator
MSASRVTTDGAAARVLSARQLEVLTLLARGLSTDGIAAELFVSRNTVRSHVRSILETLGARNRAHAVAIAFSAGLIWIDEYAIPRHPAHTRVTPAMMTVAAGLGHHHGN